MHKIKGYSSLPEQLQALFSSTYNRHMSAMGAESRKNYTTDHIKHVKWNKATKCLIVTFSNHDWWSYNLRGEWS